MNAPIPVLIVCGWVIVACIIAAVFFTRNLIEDIRWERESKDWEKRHGR